MLGLGLLTLISMGKKHVQYGENQTELYSNESSFKGLYVSLD